MLILLVSLMFKKNGNNCYFLCKIIIIKKKQLQKPHHQLNSSLFLVLRKLSPLSPSFAITSILATETQSSLRSKREKEAKEWEVQVAGTHAKKNGL